MTLGNATLPAGGADTVAPSTDIDDPGNLNFWDGGSENENQQEGSSAETNAVEPAHPPTETEVVAGEEGEQTQEEQAEGQEADTTVITLDGGAQVPLAELKTGYLRQQDYQQKAQAVANKSSELEQMSAHIAQTMDAFSKLVANHLPPNPSHDLAINDPAEYTRQKAIHDNAVAQLDELLLAGQQPRNVAAALSDGQMAEAVLHESRKLEEAFPQIKTDEGRAQFFDHCFGAAREFGFVDADFRDITDHRVFKMAHYARIGLEAEKAKANALSKVAAAAPMTVPKIRAKGPAAQQARVNQDAMTKLSQTGDIRDAMRIDFD